MKVVKFYLIIIFSFLMNVYLHSQEVFNVYSRGYVPLVDLEYSYTNTNLTYGPPSFTAVTNLIRTIIPDSFDFEKNIFLVVTYKTLSVKSNEIMTGNKVSYAIFKKDGAYTQYITDEFLLDGLFYDRNVYVLLVGDFAASDSCHISIKRMDSQRQAKFTANSSLDEIRDTDKAQNVVNKNQIPYKLMKIEKESVDAPCTVTINFNDDNSFEYNFYRLNYVFYKIGMAGYNFVSTNTNSYLTAAAVLFLEFHPFGGINFDSMSIHSSMIEDHARYQYSKFIESFGVVLGTSISLSQPPFDSMYLGLSYSLYSDFSIAGGLVWYKVINRDRISFGPQEYYPPGLFVGVAADLESTFDSIINLLKLK